MSQVTACRVWCEQAGLDEDCWGCRGGQQGMCELMSVFEARRATEELENFTAASEADL